MIEDAELREVFQTASEEHLQKLDEGFLYLEKHPDDLEKLEELLREAHSLKGDAGMLGVRDVSQLAHQLEHLLGEIKRGEQIISPEISDRFSVGLDAIRKLVQEAVTGEQSGINTVHVLANLMGAKNFNTQSQQENKIHSISQESTTISTPIEEKIEEQKVNENDLFFPTPELETTVENTPTNNIDELIATNTEKPTPKSTLSLTKTELNESSFTIESSHTSSNSYHIETVRVPTRNLDSLMTQTGELTVTQIRLAHRLAEIEEITNLWEEWSRDIFKNRFVIHDLNVSNSTTINDYSIKQLQSYHHRAESQLEKLGLLINNLRNSIHEDVAKLNLITNEIEGGVRTMRMLPLSTIFNMFYRVVRDLARQESKQVELIIEGGATKADKRIIEQMKDPLMHIIRNAVDHGIETPEKRQKLGKPEVATIKLRAYNTATNVIIEVIDDGQGLDIEQIIKTAIKQGVCTQAELAYMTQKQIQSLIFNPGFSTKKFVTEVSGRGIGLDVVKTNVEELKGSISIESQRRKGCFIRIVLSTSIATISVLIVAIENTYYALPVEYVQTTLMVSIASIFTIEGRDTIIFDNEPVSVVRLAYLLEVSVSHREKMTDEQERPCIILKVGNEQLGLFVDALIDEQDVVLKPQSKLLKRVRNVSGATILGTGDVCMVLNPQDLFNSARKLAISITIPQFIRDSNNQLEKVEIINKKSVILLAEDSISTRTQEKRILESAGYEVITAVDGLDAFNKLQTRSFDAVISDVQMPNLDGLSLTAKIRENKNYSELPIILVTSLASNEDKQKGAEVGANAYITKDSFNQEVLLETLKRLV
ncbi:MAG: hybrid sensor histidine kinase/response regulator [Okeania sp. SIO3I5]|uniref:hybrid sensor histidine kinase/response regulator n=1 Tax=Okeania sp. SIO3I5 TaxID=2607805 RepID=UPI0013BAA892|nr:hybrid sensor histidine kinase/response regulator [Okeania sp. SIO3I5]NEQ40422.1 hybrid sensor histidine kinase/response regulator [Okeania sp. SIO3I5]